jgi:hypothetical protein
MFIAFRRTARLLITAASAAPAVPRLIRGIATAATMPMITTTITSSSKLNPLRLIDLRAIRTASKNRTPGP